MFRSSLKCKRSPLDLPRLLGLYNIAGNGGTLPAANAVSTSERVRSSNCRNPNFSSNPEMIEFGDSTVFFKQDDSFDEPIVLVNVKIYCNDNNFPQNKKSKLLPLTFAKHA